jgi:GT2 family glycosyltransferase
MKNTNFTKVGKVTVVIVNYNTANLLDQCLSHLDSIAGIEKVITVDSASTDNSVELVKSNHPNVDLVVLKENKGISYGYNVGIKRSMTPYILFLGSDAYPDKNTIIDMVDYMKANPKVGIATAKLVLRDGSLDMDAHRGFPTPWTSITHFSKLDKLFKNNRIFDRYNLGFRNMDFPHEIDLCISHFMLVRKEVFESVKGFDEDFFVFGEDVDFCYRVKQNGWSIMYLPQFRAQHYKGAGIGIRKSTQDISPATMETKIRMTKETTRAMELFYKKHFMNKYPGILTYSVLTMVRIMGHYRILKFKLRSQKA